MTRTEPDLLSCQMTSRAHESARAMAITTLKTKFVYANKCCLRIFIEDMVDWTLSAECHP